MKSKVIVISGLTAGGKTTLVQALHQELANSYVISFDDYNIDAIPSAPAITEPLADHVLQYDISVLIKACCEMDGQYETLLLDFPFGNRHPDLAPLIDLTVYNQVPLDIRLARQLRRDSESEMLAIVTAYLSTARPLFIANEQFVLATADLVLDGMRPLNERVTLIIKQLKQKSCDDSLEN
ncbi:nucleoside/nucleotide kinase family protein [Lapidilactobacillus wuchangensis]|uniref:adenylylsulfate kinase n=1 Tax=Lapidilactobacillus wuchangensis TaxID=2486001 RepID=UPI000F785D9E|nr:adenylylsulfate kinase [Lapidilactobacillus wuchangensis]